jgi:hypothetical protein
VKEGTTDMVSINKKAAGIAGIAAAAVLGMGVATVAQADDSSMSTPTPRSTSTADANRGEGMGPGRGGMMGHGAKADELAADLASKLGIDKSKVEGALAAVRDDLKGDRAKGERPSAADRDAMREAFATALGKELGVDTGKVTKALEDIQTERQAERFAEHETELKQRLAAAVTDGTLTQAEADAVLKAAKAGVIGMGGGRH